MIILRLRHKRSSDEILLHFPSTVHLKVFNTGWVASRAGWVLPEAQNKGGIYLELCHPVYENRKIKFKPGEADLYRHGNELAADYDVKEKMQQWNYPKLDE